MIFDEAVARSLNKCGRHGDNITGYNMTTLEPEIKSPLVIIPFKIRYLNYFIKVMKILQFPQVQSFQLSKQVLPVKLSDIKIKTRLDLVTPS